MIFDIFYKKICICRSISKLKKKLQYFQTYDGGPTKVKLIFDNYDSGIEKIEMARPDNPYDQLFHWAGKKKRPYIGQRWRYL